MVFLSPGVTLVSRRAKFGCRELQAGQLHLEKAVRAIVLGTISKHIKFKKVMGSSQHRLKKGESCHTNLRAFYNEMTSLVGEGRPVNVVYLDLSMFTVSCNILIGKLMKDRVGK